MINCSQRPSVAQYLFAVVFLSLLFGGVAPLSADPKGEALQGTRVEISLPTALSGWLEWVRARSPEWNCARVHGEHVCIWPGFARYELSESGAVFTVHVEAQSKGEVPLPSNSLLLPHDIEVRSESNEALASNLETRDGKVFVVVPPGKYLISGRLTWDRVPPEIPSASSYGVVTASGVGVSRTSTVRRSESGFRLEQEDQNRDADSISLSVLRNIQDGSPLEVRTLLRLHIAGGARSINLGKVILDGTIPVSIESALPYQLTQTGQLALQVLPGEYEVSITSLRSQPVEQLVASAATDSLWKGEEIWVWSSDESFRSVEVSGGEPFQAQLANLPEDWNGAAYAVHTGNVLALKQLRRGEESAAPNELSQTRTLWIDLDGKGFTILDRFSGQVNRDFRLNAVSDLQLGRAAISGQPVLVTLDPSSRDAGVELRRRTLQLEAVSRTLETREISAVGWKTVVNSLSLQLNLPPSWRVLSVGGAQSVPGAWLDSWSLLDLFLTVLIALSALKLFGRFAAILVAAGFILNHGEFLAPRMLFIHLLILAALGRLVPREKIVWWTLCRLLIVSTFVAWVLEVLAFSKLQVSQLLFPQLESGTRYRTFLQEIALMLEDSLIGWPALLLFIALAFFVIRWLIGSRSIWSLIARGVVGTGAVVFACIFLGGLLASQRVHSRFQNIESSISESGSGYYDLAPSQEVEEVSKRIRGKDAPKPDLEQSLSLGNKALLSGPALPAWHWKQYQIYVAAPVGPESLLRFYLLPPSVNRALSGVRVLVLLVLTILVYRSLGFRLPQVAGPSSAAISALLLFVFPLTAGADVPSDRMLDELHERLAQQRCTRPECAVIDECAISIDQGLITVRLVASSTGVSAVTIPGILDLYRAPTVSRNGTATVALRRSGANFLEVSTVDGRNEIILSAPLPLRQPFTIQFPSPALFTSVRAAGWIAEGLSSSGQVSSEGLRLTKRSEERGEPANGQNSAQNSSLPTYVVWRRAIVIGERITIASTLERLGQSGSPVHLTLPLLPGEQVTSGIGSVQHGELVLVIPPGAESISYASTLPFAEELALSAPQIVNVSTAWSLRCEPYVACSYSGLKPTSSVESDTQEFKWLPFPTETVTVRAQGLNTAKGDFITVDQVVHTVDWGTRLLGGTIQLDARTTQQAPLSVSAPPGSSLHKVTVDGQVVSGSSESHESTVLLSPGLHKLELIYGMPWTAAMREYIPPLALSVPAHNVRVLLHPSPDRWILWIGGEMWGPSVIFWAKLLFVVLILLAIQNVGLLPCSQLGAALLGVGITTLPVIYLFIPVVWLIVLKLGTQLPSRVMAWHKAIRLGLIVLLGMLALIKFYQVVESGLVLQPPMLIVGNSSTSAELKWYIDHASTSLPQPWILSTPLWTWRAFSLAWSIWLVTALFSWLKLSVLRFKEHAQ